MIGLVGIDEVSESSLRLLVGPTTYAAYIATREPDFDSSLVGVRRANPLGMTVAVISSDRCIAVTRRSLMADQNAGLPYFIGGYLEPSPTGDLSNAICSNVMRETEEELGVAGTSARILGLAEDPEYCHPELFAVSQAHVDAVQMSALWASAPGRDEAAELTMIPIATLLGSAEGMFGDRVSWSFAAATWLLRRWYGRLSAHSIKEP